MTSWQLILYGTSTEPVNLRDPPARPPTKFPATSVPAATVPGGSGDDEDTVVVVDEENVVDTGGHKLPKPKVRVEKKIPYNLIQKLR